MVCGGGRCVYQIALPADDTPERAQACERGVGRGGRKAVRRRFESGRYYRYRIAGMILTVVVVVYYRPINVFARSVLFVFCLRVPGSLLIGYFEGLVKCAASPPGRTKKKHPRTYTHIVSYIYIYYTTFVIRWLALLALIRVSLLSLFTFGLVDYVCDCCATDPLLILVVLH